MGTLRLDNHHQSFLQLISSALMRRGNPTVDSHAFQPVTVANFVKINHLLHRSLHPLFTGFRSGLFGGHFLLPAHGSSGKQQCGMNGVLVVCSAKTDTHRLNGQCLAVILV